VSVSSISASTSLTATQAPASSGRTGQVNAGHHRHHKSGNDESAPAATTTQTAAATSSTAPPKSVNKVA
jgi:hypothetical protein